MLSDSDLSYLWLILRERKTQYCQERIRVIGQIAFRIVIFQDSEKNLRNK